MVRGLHWLRTGRRVVEGKGQPIYAFPQARVAQHATPRDRLPHSCKLPHIRKPLDIGQSVDDRDPAPDPTVAPLSPSFPDSIRTSHTLIWRAHWLVRHQATAAIYVWILSSATRKLTMISKEASFNGRASRQTVEARGPTLTSRHSPICRPSRCTI